MDREIHVGEIYRHFKGNRYEVIALGMNADTRESVVVYKALYGEGRVFVRSYAGFVSEVNRKKYPDARQKYRFELEGAEDTEDVEAEAEATAEVKSVESAVQTAAHMVADAAAKAVTDTSVPEKQEPAGENASIVLKTSDDERCKRFQP